MKQEEEPIEAAPVPCELDREAELRRIALRLAECTSVLEAWMLKSQLDRLLQDGL